MTTLDYVLVNFTIVYLLINGFIAFVISVVYLFEGLFGNMCEYCRGTGVRNYGKYYGNFPCPKCQGTGKQKR